MCLHLCLTLGPLPAMYSNSHCCNVLSFPILVQSSGCKVHDLVGHLPGGRVLNLARVSKALTE